MEPAACCVTMEEDRISNLAPELIDHIISYLPVTDAIRTSTLSSKWHGRWRYAVRHIDLEDFSSLPFFDKIAEGVLATITGQIDSLKVHIRDMRSIPTVNLLICHAVNHGATSFDLSIKSMSNPYYLMCLPNYVLSCPGLKSLCLSRFHLEFPLGFQKFETLTTLVLESCKLSPGVDLVGIIVNSPSLTYLNMNRVHGCDDIEISSPSLRSFSILSPISLSTKRVNLKNCPNLRKASIRVELGYHPPSAISDVLWGPCNKIQALEIAMVDYYSCKPPSPMTLRHELTQLCSLKVVLPLWVTHQLSFLFCILRSSPTLKDLKIFLIIHIRRRIIDTKNSNAKGWLLNLDEEVQGLILGQLTSVRLNCSSQWIAKGKVPWELCKFFLASSPALQRLVVCGKGLNLTTEEKTNHHEKLCMLAKSSLNVSIQIEG